jgi:methyl-accepting chemotaxis protein
VFGQALNHSLDVDMDKLTLFIAVTSSAVVLQMLILLGMFLTMRKLGARVQGLADKAEETTAMVQTRVLPIIDKTKTIQEDVKNFLDTARPKIETLIDNASRISTTTRATVERFDATANDAIDRVRLQVIRGDEMLTRTMDRVEETSEKVQHTVMSPVRQVSGIMQAISTGMGAYFNTQRRRRNGGPSDEMFI